MLAHMCFSFDGKSSGRLQHAVPLVFVVLILHSHWFVSHEPKENVLVHTTSVESVAAGLGRKKQLLAGPIRQQCSFTHQMCDLNTVASLAPFPLLQCRA
jgi:hypothetical protein